MAQELGHATVADVLDDLRVVPDQGVRAHVLATYASERGVAADDADTDQLWWWLAGSGVAEWFVDGAAPALVGWTARPEAVRQRALALAGRPWRLPDPGGPVGLGTWLGRTR